MSTTLAALLVTLLNVPEPGDEATDSSPAGSHADGDESLGADMLKAVPKPIETMITTETGHSTHVERDK